MNDRVWLKREGWDELLEVEVRVSDLPRFCNGMSSDLPVRECGCGHVLVCLYRRMLCFPADVLDREGEELLRDEENRGRSMLC